MLQLNFEQTKEISDLQTKESLKEFFIPTKKQRQKKLPISFFSKTNKDESFIIEKQTKTKVDLIDSVKLKLWYLC